MHAVPRLPIRRVLIGLLPFAFAASVAACASNTPNVSANQGPKPTNNNPGPNTTAKDPGPNSTTSGVETVSGIFSVVAGSCARLVLDANQETLTLNFSEPYIVTPQGLTSAKKVIATANARMFVTGKHDGRNGACGHGFTVDTLVSVR